MRRKQNVIIFSAGESVRNGNVEYIKQQLKEKDIICSDWRELFEQAHDTEHIALLPSLSKKIPTFDFALILAEGVDKIKLRGDDELSAMRDNVVFELGLCVMALGVERVILLAEETVRIPEDLVGIGKIGIECVIFSSANKVSAVQKVEHIILDRSESFSRKFSSQLNDIVEHININAELISPVFIGAAVSSAEAYFLNFIVRLLENADKGFSPKNNMGIRYKFPDDFKIKIIVPSTIDSLTRNEISKYYKKHNFQEFVIQDAGIRGLFFNGKFNEIDNSLTIVDIPTSITASYAVVNSILNIDSDDDFDTFAEERFVTKEMDVYAFALNKLLISKVARERLAFITDIEKKEKILEMMKNVKIDIINILV